MAGFNRIDGMINDPLYRRLLELSWRRKLSSSEEAELAALLAKQPEVQLDWEVEAALNAGLKQLPDAPVPSNFTALVLQAVERESRASINAQSKLLIWRLLPRLGFAVLAGTVGFVAYQQTIAARQAGYAQSVEAVSDISPALNPEILKDFETIRAMNRMPSPDEQLLNLLQ
jgi:hypothetical protein